ncbi:MAG: ABC transporter ATP-binding protein [Acidobacteriia bacterium]|jgi:ABC-2 type transport system ATP-binding protein|nr:ABC transporter ATP-binding protein [Terriglobia bacterium]
MTAPVIELDNLRVKIGKREILRGLNLELRGKTVGLLGPNGAGKSTLINTLLGFWKPAEGTARVLGYDVRTDARKIRANIGFMPESDSFIGNMPAISFVRMAAELSGLPPDAALERAHEALFYVGLGEARYRVLGAYSLGMRQMAKLAQAIVHGPKLVILDEPTNGLDPQARIRMIKLIQEMRALGTMHLVICSHLLRDIEETCEEAVILKAGQVVHYSNLEEERSSNRRFVELETEGDDGTFADAIERLGCACAITGPGKIKTVLPEGIEVRDIYRLAADRDVQLRRLNFRRDSLEDIFLKAMEK